MCPRADDLLGDTENGCAQASPLSLSPHRFRVGFKHAFRCCPFISASNYEGLEMKSTRYLQTQGSVYKVSRLETTVSTVVGAQEEELEDGPKATPSTLDLTSNGSSRSDSKTMTESLSFYSNMLS